MGWQSVCGDGGGGDRGEEEEGDTREGEGDSLWYTRCRQMPKKEDWKIHVTK